MICPIHTEIVKILFISWMGLFVFSGFTFSQQRKNELNTFAGLMVNSEIKEGVIVKGIEYDRWLNACFSIGGGIVSFGNVSIYQSWNINQKECYILDEDINRFLLSIQTQIQLAQVSFSKGHSVGLLIKPAMLIQLFPVDFLTFKKYADLNNSFLGFNSLTFIDSEKRSYRSGSTVYFDGSIMIAYKFKSLTGINVGYRVSTVDVHKNLRERHFGNIQFNTFLPLPKLLQGGEIGLLFYF